MTTAHEIADLAKREIAELTGLPVDTVSSVSRKEDKWVVTLDLIELRKIPSTQDVLGTYEIELKENGTTEMLGYRRLSRYRRDQLVASYA